MTIQKHLLHICVSTNLFSQSDKDVFHQFSFGITHSAFASACFQHPVNKKTYSREENLNLQNQINIPLISETNIGCSLGFFNYIPIADHLAIRSTFETAFTTNYTYQSNSTYSRALSISVNPSLCIALKKADDEGVIYVVRNMSCYLTYKQPYLSIGPVMTIQKFDYQYLQKGFQNQLCVGLAIGYGINYEFHGTIVSPEIKYQVTSTSQNKISETNKIYHSLSLSINIF